MGYYAGQASSKALDNTLRLLTAVLATPLLVLLMLLVNLLQILYAIDLIAGGWLLVVIFLGPFMLSIVWWGAALCAAPLGVALSDDASVGARMLALALTPVGLAAGFMLWQLQNALVYGAINVEPNAYNWMFDRVGLGI